MTPAFARAMVRPMVADELCTATVQSVPTAIAPRTAPKGRYPFADGAQSKREKKEMNSGSLANALSSWLIMFMPKKRRPNPRTVRQAPRIIERWATISPTTPSTTEGSARSVTLSETSWPVTVVPMFAPKTTPIACVSERSPALTNPTVMTVVAEELWMSAVMPAPAAIAATRFFVT